MQPLAAKAEQTLERVVVTGSRIPRAQQEGPSPVTVISSEEIQNRGYRNVFEALQTQTQNTGMTQGRGLRQHLAAGGQRPSTCAISAPTTRWC